MLDLGPPAADPHNRRMPATPSSTRMPAASTAAGGASDEALMLAYVNGDLAAFERLYGRHERPVYRFLLRSVAIPALADELLQETWLSVVRAAATYEQRARFTTWLYHIARTRLVDHWRAREPAIVQCLGNDDGPDAAMAVAADAHLEPQVIAMDRAQARAYVLAVEALPPAQREVFLLHADSGLTIEQIGTITGVPPETAKSRFRYACAKLRASLREWNTA